ncbi:MAG: response regulator transcription factor [Desulfobacteraceae bacterium]|nr:response regulator transcription factor [Desulfobacteraceae bacterium]
MRLLLVEDDAKIAMFVMNGLKQAGYAVDHFSDGEDGLQAALMVPYDLSIIDIMLPKLNGIALIESMRSQEVNTPVLILSAKREVDDRVKGLKAGGDDYLTKPFAFAELLARVQALLRRANKLSNPSSLVVADLTMNLQTRKLTRGESIIELQPLEFSLLEYLMRNAGQVVSKTMIMEHVWDYNFSPGTNVVESKICYLRDKIDKHHGIKLIHTIRGVGYVLKSD